jgi:signal transduction histidine kinase
LASEKATPLEIVQKVVAAEKFLTDNGLSKLSHFNNAESDWSWGGTYVFVLDCSKITVAAHPVQPGLIGRDLASLRDVKGKLFFRELCTASEKGGWVEYYWPKPGEKEASRKISYMRQVPGTGFQVGAGLYEDVLEIEELVDFTDEYFSFQEEHKPK